MICRAIAKYSLGFAKASPWRIIFHHYSTTPTSAPIEVIPMKSSSKLVQELQAQLAKGDKGSTATSQKAAVQKPPKGFVVVDQLGYVDDFHK